MAKTNSLVEAGEARFDENFNVVLTGQTRANYTRWSGWRWWGGVFSMSTNSINALDFAIKGAGVSGAVKFFMQASVAASWATFVSSHSRRMDVDHSLPHGWLRSPQRTWAGVIVVTPHKIQQGVKTLSMPQDLALVGSFRKNQKVFHTCLYWIRSASGLTIVCTERERNRFRRRASPASTCATAGMLAPVKRGALPKT